MKLHYKSEEFRAGQCSIYIMYLLYVSIVEHFKCPHVLLVSSRIFCDCNHVNLFLN